MQGETITLPIEQWRKIYRLLENTQKDENDAILLETIKTAGQNEYLEQWFPSDIAERVYKLLEEVNDWSNLD